MMMISFLSLFSQNYSISGKIVDFETLEPLIEAEIFCKVYERGSYSNLKGFYNIQLPKGLTSISYKYLGYETKFLNINITKDTIVNIQLTPIIENLKEVNIQSKNEIHRQTLMGKISFSTKSLEEIPSFLGENDLLKAITILPGITEGREGYSNIYVRGGDRGQNLILYDGMKLYNTNHVGGLISLFNTDVVKQVNVYKSGFPARFGGRASSVIEILTKDGNRNKTEGKFKLGLLSSSLTVETPLNKKTSFFISGRTSYFDLFTLHRKRIIRKTSDGSYTGYTFLDINTKLTHYISEYNTISIAAYTGHDFQNNYFVTRGCCTDISKQKIHNTGVAINQYYTINPKLYLKNNIYYSHYSNTNNTENTNENQKENFSSFSKLNEWGINSSLDYYFNTKHAIKLGVETNYSNYLPLHQSKYNYLNDILYNEENGGYDKKLNYGEFNFFIEDEIRINEKQRFNFGFRTSFLQAKDTSYFRMEPRISYSWFFHKQMSFKANFTTVHQFNHLLINNYDGFENEVWFNSTKNLPPEKANQFSIGFFRSSADGKYSLSLETYYKKMTNLLNYSTPTDVNENTTLLDDIVETNGKGEAYGVETQIQKNLGLLKGSLSYTLSWSNRWFDNINNGQSFPFIYDRRHNLSLQTYLPINKKYRFSTNFILQSGKPITLPVGYVTEYSWYEGVKGYFVYNGIHNARMPIYHRLDVAFGKHTTTKKGREESLELNIFNVYARQNPIHIYLDPRTGKMKQKALFSIIPTLTYSLNF